MSSVVIVGAGQAGLSAAVALRSEGWEGAIYLIGEETEAPYQRPPLTKGYLSGAETPSDLLLRNLDALLKDEIDFRPGTLVETIDLEQRRVICSDGDAIDYDFLILATGSTPRRLNLPGCELEGIYTIRTVEDANRLREHFQLKGDTVFVGGGFLNLEVAIEAAKYGRATVIEVGPQILGRVVSPETACALAQYHSTVGVDIQCNANISSIESENDSVSAVILEDGRRIPASRVIVSIGAVPTDSLASSVGLATDNGVVVDNLLRTNAPGVYAIGDCATYPNRYSGTRMRVESVQNATDQARYVARQIVAGPDETSQYSDVPWFWSNQGAKRLQIAGIALPSDETRVVQSDESGKLIVERLRRGEVVAVETINAPGAHMKARKTLAK